MDNLFLVIMRFSKRQGNVKVPTVTFYPKARHILGKKSDRNEAQNEQL